jgi:hypothetical protein
MPWLSHLETEACASSVSVSQAGIWKKFLMKTFNELISWELEQEAKQKTSQLKLTEGDGAGKLSASVLRKLRYLNAVGRAAPKTSDQGFSAA